MATGGDAPHYNVNNTPPSGWGSYRKKTVTQAIRMNGPFTCETQEGTVRCEDGWLALDADGWPYPISADVFEKTYEEAAPAPTSGP